jgi:hypothetical protein
MPRRTSNEDLLNPSRVFYNLLREYEEGHLNQNRIFYRAVVEEVDNTGGLLEASPPNPPKSIKARVYTYGIDATNPSESLTVFYPFFPEHISTPVSIGEHVYVIFEDNFTSGMWLTTVPHMRDINFNDPEENRVGPVTSAHRFEGRRPETTSVNRDREFGGRSNESRTRTNNAAVFNDNNSIFVGKRVLHVGDSQVVGPMGREIGRMIREAGASYYYNEGRASWGVYAWLNMRLRPGSPLQPSLQDVIRVHRPDIILITLGGNDHSVGARNSNYIDKVREFYDIARGSARTIWTGPPTTVGENARIQPGRDIVTEKIKSVVGGNFVENRDLTGEANRDSHGLHFTLRGGREWAESLLTRIERNF